MAAVTQQALLAIGFTPITRTFKTSGASASDLTTYTFSAVIATATRSRKCVAVFTARQGVALSLSSCTLAGVTATCTTMVTGTTCVAIAVVDLPAGSSGDAVPTFSAGAARASYAIYDMFDAPSATPTATGSDTADAFTYSLTCTAGSVVFAAGGDAQSSTSWTWTNLTEDADSVYGADAQSYSHASAEFAAAQSALTLTGDIATSAAGAGGFAVFSP